MTQPPNGDGGGGLGSLRWDAYVAAPDEQVLRLSVASSLFPHLPLRSRNVFRVGLAVLFLLLIALGLLRWQAPMIAVSALGLPLMFLLYLYEANIHRDLTLRDAGADRVAWHRARRRMGARDRIVGGRFLRCVVGQRILEKARAAGGNCGTGRRGAPDARARGGDATRSARRGSRWTASSSGR